MKRPKFNIRKRIKLAYLKMYHALTSNDRNDIRARKPNNLDDAQTAAVEIISKLLFNPKSNLYYDSSSQEFYVKYESPDGNFYAFIESGSVKIINTTFGYDVPMSHRGESYVRSLFRKEMLKRKERFKKEALSKVNYTLYTVLDHMREHYKNC